MTPRRRHQGDHGPGLRAGGPHLLGDGLRGAPELGVGDLSPALLDRDRVGPHRGLLGDRPQYGLVRQGPFGVVRSVDDGVVALAPHREGAQRFVGVGAHRQQQGLVALDHELDVAAAVGVLVERGTDLQGIAENGDEELQVEFAESVLDGQQPRFPATDLEFRVTVGNIIEDVPEKRIAP